MTHDNCELLFYYSQFFNIFLLQCNSHVFTMLLELMNSRALIKKHLADVDRQLIVDQKYGVENCEKDCGLQKVFNEIHQACLYPYNISLESLRLAARCYPVKVGDSCQIDDDCEQSMICQNKHCKCKENYEEFNQNCYKDDVLCPNATVTKSHGSIITCSFSKQCPQNSFCHYDKTNKFPSVCCHEKKQSAEICWPWAPYFVNEKPLKCNPESNPCPHGFSCQFDEIMNSHFCCMKRASINFPSKTTVTATAPTAYQPATFRVCPTGSAPYLLNACAPQTQVNGCPEEFSCQLHHSTGAYFCCEKPKRRLSTVNMNRFSSNSNMAPIVVDGCPPMTISASIESGKPMLCNLLHLNSCPSGSVCLYSQFYRHYQCCYPEKKSSISYSEKNTAAAISAMESCPKGELALRDQQTGMNVRCKLNSSISKTCPIGYTCKPSERHIGSGICCSKNLTCPAGSSHFTDPSTLLPMRCSVNDDNNCPAGYGCLFSQNSGICCSLNKNDGFKKERDKLCPAGDPLADTVKRNSFHYCSQFEQCPIGYECTNTLNGSLCCPTRETVCTQLLNNGVSCELSRSVNYFFNVKLGICQPLFYKGCAGNANNFPTIAACENFCFSGMCQKGNPALENGKLIRCDFSDKVCPLEHRCVHPVYGPPSLRVCCPSASIICSFDKDEGSFCNINQINGSVIRYYFDFNTRSCQSFQFKGCEGNSNNFESLKLCMKFCSGFTTPLSPLHSSFALKQRNFNIQSNSLCKIPGHHVAPGFLNFNCDPFVSSSCPEGYSCQSSVNNQGYICCGKSLRDNVFYSIGSLCPTGSSVYTQAINNEALKCNVEQSCPHGYVCSYSQTAQQHYCCSVEFSETKLEDCPLGHPYIYSNTNQPLSCKLEDDHCPTGYRCHISPITNALLCCPANEEVLYTTVKNAFAAKAHSPLSILQTLKEKFTPKDGQVISLTHSPKVYNNAVGSSTPCDTSLKKIYGQQCCSDEQCLYKCIEYKSKKICSCPRHLLLDLTMETPRCVSRCDKQRDGAFCVRQKWLKH
ncbi:Uncharacterized protein T4D_12695 [Trichinella pseudospiralis]|uniref:BPTI/Kunitz inhibitor domain-containing protein n=1 Tax=Trichinella pseudospiralis TaxID=6337 RepID=A0A0V1G107_TRIPS|nr:Uncharacterized protein T4D_12695 [Trichinella pseudospiralis]